MLDTIQILILIPSEGGSKAKNAKELLTINIYVIDKLAS